MTFQRGDVILVPIPFTNLAAATAPVDYIIKDWAEAGLRFPSAFKPLIFTLEPALVIHRVGSLSSLDMAEIGRRLRHALGL